MKLSKKQITTSFFAALTVFTNCLFAIDYAPKLNSLAKRIPSKVNGTQKVLAILVEFQKETVDDKSTTGKGEFATNLSQHFVLTGIDSVETKHNEIIDVAPHNREFFEFQLQAVKTYYEEVSNGNLEIEYEVYPKTGNAYRLPRQMAFYNPATSESALDRGLTRLVVDAFEAADKDKQIIFSDFSHFVIFHAGVGNDIALGFDETPNDIPSVFLDKTFFDTNLPKAYRPEIDPIYETNPKRIIVGNGEETTGFEITKCVVLPETESQVGLQVGMTGTAVLQLGFSFGLPSLFDTDDGSPGIGNWGLMDQGSANLRGLLPAEPCAWTKSFQGWLVPQKITKNQTSLEIRAKTPTQNQNIYKIPITNSEYFLVENRNRKLGTDSLTYATDSNGNQIGLKVGKFGLLEMIVDPNDTLGVILKAENYDLAIPGDGILIWHIDDSIIKKRIAANSINSSDTLRAVNLMEADGVQDIGQEYGFFSAGAGKETGTANDAWYSENFDWVKNNRAVYTGVDKVEFKSFSRPSTKANTGGFSHLKIDNFSSRGTVMTFDVNFENTIPGFPIETPISSKITESFSIKNNSEIIFVSDGTVKRIFWNETLNSTEDSSVVFFTNLKSDLDNLPLSDELQSEIQPYSQPNGSEEILISGETGLYSFGIALKDFPQNETVTAGPITKQGNILQKIILVGTASGKLFGIENRGDFDTLLVTQNLQLSSQAITHLAYGKTFAFAVSGNSIFKINLSNFENFKIADLSESVLNLISEGEELVVLTKNSLQVLQNDGEFKEGFPVKISNSLGLAIEDFDLDGRTELVVTTSEKIYAFSTNGVLKNNFPVTIVDDKIVSPPAIGNVNSELDGEIIFTTGKGLLMAIDSEGKIVQDFPISFSSNSSSEVPIIANFLPGEETEIFVNGTDVFGFTIPNSKFTERPLWSGEGGNKFHSSFVENSNEEIKPEVAESGVLHKVYNYPNPAKTETKIRFYLTKDTEVKVRIYDLAGHFVVELVKQGRANQAGEILWNLDKVSNGVYYTKVEADGDSKIIKIAVTK